MAGYGVSLPDMMWDRCACASAGALHAAPDATATTSCSVDLPRSISNRHGVPHQRGFSAPVDKTLDLSVHMALDGGCFIRCNNLYDLIERYEIVKALGSTSATANTSNTTNQQHAGALFPPADALHLNLLNELRAQVAEGAYSNAPSIATSALQRVAQKCLQHYNLPYDPDFWTFELQNRVYPLQLPGQEMRLFDVQSAHSCRGQLALWRVPRELELFFCDEKARLQDQLQGTYQRHLWPTPGATADVKSENPMQYHSSVVPSDLHQLLQVLRTMMSPGNIQQGKGLTFKLMFLGERVTFPLLALDLHADPTGMLLHPANVILQTPGADLQLTRGSCLSGRKPLWTPPGSRAVLVDAWHVPALQHPSLSSAWAPAEVRLKSLFSNPGDYDSLSSLVRIKAQGISVIPSLNVPGSHRSTALMSALVPHIQDIVMAQGLNLQALAEESPAHSSTLDWVSRIEYTFPCMYARAQHLLQWWSGLSAQQQQQLVLAHKGQGRDVMRSLGTLQTSNIRSASYSSAVSQLYTEVLPASARAAAEATEPLLKGLGQQRQQQSQQQQQQQRDQQQQQQQHAPAPGKVATRRTTSAGDQSAVPTKASACSVPDITASVCFPAAAAAAAAAAGNNSNDTVPDRSFTKATGCPAAAAAAAAANGTDILQTHVSTTETLEDVAQSDRDSPDYAPPRRKQKTCCSASTAVKQQQPPSKASPPPATAAAVEAFNSNACGNLLPQATAPIKLFEAPASTSSAEPIIHPPVYYLNAGKQKILRLLKQHDNTPAAAPDIIAMGRKFEAVTQQMVSDGSLLLESKDVQPIHNAQVLVERVTKGVYVWGTLAMVGYGGTQLQQHDLGTARELVESGQIMSSHRCEAAPAEFAAARAHPYMLIETKYRIADGRNGVCRCYGKSGDTCLNVEVYASSKDELAECRKALFYITIVLMLQWHGQHRKMHPRLSEFLDSHELEPIAPQQQPARKEDTTAGDASDLGVSLAKHFESS